MNNEALCTSQFPLCLQFSFDNLCDFRHMTEPKLHICSVQHGRTRHSAESNTGPTVGFNLPIRSRAALWNERDTPCI
jgi:hypothetical protein